MLLEDLPSMMRSLSISGLHTLHTEPIVWPGIPPRPIQRYHPSISSHPLNPPIRLSVWLVTPLLSSHVRVWPQVYPRRDIFEHIHELLSRLGPLSSSLHELLAMLGPLSPSLHELLSILGLLSPSLSELLAMLGLLSPLLRELLSIF